MKVQVRIPKTGKDGFDTVTKTRFVDEYLAEVVATSGNDKGEFFLLVRKESGEFVSIKPTQCKATSEVSLEG